MPTIPDKAIMRFPPEIRVGIGKNRKVIVLLFPASGFVQPGHEELLPLSAKNAIVSSRYLRNPWLPASRIQRDNADFTSAVLFATSAASNRSETMQTRLAPAPTISRRFSNFTPPIQKIGSFTCSCSTWSSLRPTALAVGLVPV